MQSESLRGLLPSDLQLIMHLYLSSLSYSDEISILDAKDDIHIFSQYKLDTFIIPYEPTPGTVSESLLCLILPTESRLAEPSSPGPNRGGITRPECPIVEEDGFLRLS